MPGEYIPPSRLPMNQPPASPPTIRGRFAAEVERIRCKRDQERADKARDRAGGLVVPSLIDNLLEFSEMAGIVELVRPSKAMNHTMTGPHNSYEGSMNPFGYNIYYQIRDRYKGPIVFEGGKHYVVDQAGPAFLLPNVWAPKGTGTAVLWAEDCPDGGPQAGDLFYPRRPNSRVMHSTERNCDLAVEYAQFKRGIDEFPALDLMATALQVQIQHLEIQSRMP